MNLRTCAVSNRQLLSLVRCVFDTTGSPVTAWLRDCRSGIPAEAAGHLPIGIADHCVNVTFNYVYHGFPLEVHATVCPCRTELCNAGDITTGGTVSTTTTTRQPATTRRSTTPTRSSVWSTLSSSPTAESHDITSAYSSNMLNSWSTTVAVIAVLFQHVIVKLI